MNHKTGLFVSHVVTEMISSGISVTLKQSQRLQLEGDLKCSGYFDSENKEFACAMGKSIKKWLPVFVHEYGHFTQWKDGLKLWDQYGNDIGIQKFDGWLEGTTELTDLQLKKAVRIIKALELDCEKRAVKIAQQFDLDIDLEPYIRRANSYILFYNVVRDERKWYSKTTPYEVPEILEMMKPYWLKDYTKTPKKFYKLVVERCMGGSQ